MQTSVVIFGQSNSTRVFMCAVNGYRKEKKKYISNTIYTIYYRRCINYLIMYIFDGIYGNVDVLDNTNEDVT